MAQNFLPTFEAFNPSSLFHSLADKHSPLEKVSELRLVQNLASYLLRIRCRSFLIEVEYVDNDYLEDFGEFYAQCTGAHYRSRTKRVHFFSRDIPRNFLDSILNGNKLLRKRYFRYLDAAYLGFIVCRPLPHAIIGRSVLRPYPKDDTDMGLPKRFTRYYTCLSQTKVSLYGIALTVQGLPFQMQNSIAACGTTALWTTFHATNAAIGNLRPSPSQITKTANIYVAHDRPFPSKNLSVDQVGRTMIEFGVMPSTLESRPTLPIKSLMYAYLKGGFPLILVISFRNKENKEIENPLHAVAISGFHMPGPDIAEYSLEASNSHNGFNTLGQQITEVYAHDSSIGPYSKIGIEENPHWNIQDSQQSAHRATNHPLRLVSTWDGEDSISHAIPDMFVVALPKLVTVPFEEIYSQARAFHLFLGNDGIELFDKDEESGVHWDIWLTSVNDYKSDLIVTKCCKGERRSFLSRENLPKYLWVVRCLGEKELGICDLILDATDVETAPLILDVLWQSESHFVRFVDRFDASKKKDNGIDIASKYFHHRMREAFLKIIDRMRAAR